MPIYIRETLGKDNIKHVQWSRSDVNLLESYVPKTDDEVLKQSSPSGALIVKGEGVHNILSRNLTNYTDEALEKSVPTWLAPYAKPVILYHNEQNGRTIGRILNVDHTKSVVKSGLNTLLFTYVVPDKDCDEQIKDGRLKTLSIGAIGHDVRCSICGANIADEDCEHKLGVSYDGKLCTWTICDFEGKELSYVIVPSDPYAQTIGFYEEGKENKNLKEFFSLNKGLSLKEENNMSVPENKDNELTKKIEDLEASLKLLKDNSEAMKVNYDTLQTNYTALETKYNDLKKKYDEANTAVDNAKADLKKAQDDTAAKDSQIKTQTDLKTAAETECGKVKTELKEALKNDIVCLREYLGKEKLEDKDFADRAIESLRDTAKDLREEYKNFAAKHITEVKDPTGGKKDPKPAGNVSLEESFKDIMSGLMNPMGRK